MRHPLAFASAIASALLSIVTPTIALADPPTDDVAVKAALARETATLDVSADAPSQPSGQATGAPGVLAPRGGDLNLARIHSGTGAKAAQNAGASRDVKLEAGMTATVVRPAATPRTLRRMNAERAVAAIEPALQSCADKSTTTAPTTLTLRVSVAPTGEVELVEGPKGVRAVALLACATSAVKGARFGAPGAAGALVALPITIPGRPATPPAPTSAEPETVPPVSVATKT